VSTCVDLGTSEGNGETAEMPLGSPRTDAIGGGVTDATLEASGDGSCELDEPPHELTNAKTNQLKSRATWIELT
jgi:hypothetical protein